MFMISNKLKSISFELDKHFLQYNSFFQLLKLLIKKLLHCNNHVYVIGKNLNLLYNNYHHLKVSMLFLFEGK